MAMVIENNMAAQLTLGELNKNANKLGKQLKKVASGERITGAGDDSSGFAISERMRVRIRALSQADRNTQTGISLIRTAEGAIQSQIEILKTIKAKVLDAQNDTNTDTDRAIIQKEIDQGYRQMEDITYETNYNGILLLCGGDVKDYEHTNWSEEEQPEFSIHDNSTMNIKPLITTTVTEVKGQNRVWTGMNQQPLDPDSTVLDSVSSVYDMADKYNSSVKDTLSMAGGVNWQPATSTIAIVYDNMRDTMKDVLNSLKNRSFEVTLNGEMKKFTFADDLTASKAFVYTYSYDYTDADYNLQTVSGRTGTVYVDVTPTPTYADDPIKISLQGIVDSLPAAGTAQDAANTALGRLADAIAAAFGIYNIGGSTSQTMIYGDYISNGVLTLASGEYDFTVSVGTDALVSYVDESLADNVQRAIDSVKNSAATQDLASTPHNSGPTNIQETHDTPTISSLSGTAGAITDSNPNHVAEQSAYVDLDLTTLMGGATDIESLINNFTFKVKDDELSGDTDAFDTGNNHVVDRSFTVTDFEGSRLTFEFIDSARDNTGSQYLYDEQKIPGSTVCDLNDLRSIYNTNGHNLKAALAKFLYDSLDYVSYGRNKAYTRQLMDDGDNVVGSASATKIRLYAYQPYASAPSTPTTPPYMNHSHYDTGRYSGKGELGNDDKLTMSETYLTSYDLDFKNWWIENINADPTAAGDENTEQMVQEKLNQRGFRFYCGDDNTSSSLKEWVNIYFTDHSIEEDIALERPAAGETVTTGDKIDTIVVDIRNIRSYKDLVRAIYEQANPRNAGGAEANEGQVGFEGSPLRSSTANTDYFDRFLFAMDEDKGILTIYDTKRSPQKSEMFVSDGVYDNVRLEVREIKEKRLIIHDTDHASQAVVVHIPRTTMDYVFGFNPAKDSLSNYTVLRKDMREKMLGSGRDGIGILDRGLDYLTGANCLLGAQINRLEYSHANLVTSVENTEKSESTFRDADMAKEMTEYTKANVLVQAAQSMLAQANQNSSQILGLLQ